MNHYETLGVERDATAADIKAAWRRKSSDNHPDREGGSTEKMQAVNAAYEVLGDPERRARYDETGEDSRGPTLKDEARGLLTRMFSDAIGLNGPVLVYVYSSLTNLREETHVAMSDYRSRQKRLHARRRTVKNKGDENLFHELVDGELTDLAGRLRMCERLLETIKVAGQMLDGYESVQEERPATMDFGSLALISDSLNSRYGRYYQQGQF